MSQIKLLTPNYLDGKFTTIKTITKIVPNKNQYEQIIEALKENHNTRNNGCYVITVQGGTYFVIGNQAGDYGGYLAFSYWDGVVHIKDQGGIWTYTII